MTDKVGTENNLPAAFDAFCRKLLEATPPGSAGDLQRLILEPLATRLIELALDHCGGNQVAAAKLLGIHRNTLHRKLRQSVED